MKVSVIGTVYFGSVTGARLADARKIVDPAATRAADVEHTGIGRT